MAVTYVSAGRLDYYWNKWGIVFIDVRSRAEYAKSHFQGAVNMPYEELEKKLIQRSLDEFNKDKTYIMYCDRGTKSLVICDKFSEMGYNVMTVVGGIKEYRGNHLTR